MPSSFSESPLSAAQAAAGAITAFSAPAAGAVAVLSDAAGELTTVADAVEKLLKKLQPRRYEKIIKDIIQYTSKQIVSKDDKTIFTSSQKGESVITLYTPNGVILDKFSLGYEILYLITDTVDSSFFNAKSNSAFA